MFFKFPDNFFWGSATSSHQVEGNNFNDWTEWEKKNAQKLARKAETRWAGWQKSWFPEMFLKENYLSSRACDHYTRFENDFDIAKTLFQNSHRFSLEWSRLEPKQGEFDQKEIDHYKRVVFSLRERTMEPFVTLWHFTLPCWIRDIGGWKNRKTIGYFSRYAERMAKELGSQARFWITLNEPSGFCRLAFFGGGFPPQEINPFSLLSAMKNLTLAHQESYGAIKSVLPEAKVGIAENIVDFSSSPILGGIGEWFNFYFLNRIRDFQDFVGVNYYFRGISGSFSKKPGNKEISDLGWELYPEGIYNVLKKVDLFRRPIFITENGLADSRDEKREWFIRETLKNVVRAIREGVEIGGYFYWSLLDNFEWDKGFWPRFGLVAMDYKTLERQIRQSAYYFAKICRENQIEID